MKPYFGDEELRGMWVSTGTAKRSDGRVMESTIIRDLTKDSSVKALKDDVTQILRSVRCFLLGRCDFATPDISIFPSFPFLHASASFRSSVHHFALIPDIPQTVPRRTFHFKSLDWFWILRRGRCSPSSSMNVHVHVPSSNVHEHPVVLWKPLASG